MDIRQGLSVQGIYKSYGKTQALDGVSFEAPLDQISAILGPSGCGKSTLLSIIAGLESPDAGEVRWQGRSLDNIPTHLRGFGLMFQDFALFPHMNVYDNVAFGLHMSGEDEVQIHPKVAATLDMVGLKGFELRDVNTLSGGEQQRIALARSLVPQPHLLMLDEPLGSLDRGLRERLTIELRDILSHLHQTALYVTHDQEEAFAMADQVVVLNTGRVEQTGIPQEIYRKPASIFVAKFLGLTNLLPGIASQAGALGQVSTPIGTFPISKPVSGEVTVLIRPDAMRLDDRGPVRIDGQVIQTTFRGAMCRLTVMVKGISMVFEIPSSIPIPMEKETVYLSFNPDEAIQLL